MTESRTKAGKMFDADGQLLFRVVIGSNSSATSGSVRYKILFSCETLNPIGPNSNKRPE